MKNTKKRTILLLTLLIVLCLALLTACNGLFFGGGIQYTVTFDVNGGELSEKSKKLTVDEEFQLPVPTRTDYVFKGWYCEDEQLTDEQGNGLRRFNAAEDITVTAKWQLDENNDLLKPFKVTVSGENCIITDVIDETVTSLTIPDNVTEIHAYFGRCTNLTSVYYTGDIAGWCGIVFGNNEQNPLTYACNLYIDDILVEDLVIPDTVREIKNYAFNKATCLKSVTIGSGVKSIGDYAFFNCNNLTSVTIGSGVTSIGRGAFCNCTGLTSVTIGKSVNKMEEGAFANCTGLTAVHCTGAMEHWCMGITFKSRDANPLYFAGNLYIDGKLMINVLYTGVSDFAFCGATCIRGAIFTSGRKMTIGVGAFAGSGLTHLEMGNLVTSIGGAAFEDCAGLTSVEIPDSVTEIGGYTFAGCGNLTNVTFGKGVTTIGDQAFYKCSRLTDVEIPDSVTKIGVEAFSSCVKFTHITIPDSVTSIGESAFQYCTSLTCVTIGSGVKSIWTDAFDKCFSLTSVYYTGNVAGWCGIDFSYYGGANPLEYAGNLYIDNTLVEDLVIPDTVTEIKYYAFDGATCLKSVTIPKGVTKIGHCAFYGCTGLTDVTIPDGVTEIEWNTFSHCVNIRSVTLPSSVTSIGASAFNDCGSLTDITIPRKVTSIENYAFYKCYKLVEVRNRSALKITVGSQENGYVAYYAKNVTTNGSRLTVDNNGYVVYDDGKNQILMDYVGEQTDLTLPTSVTEIYQYAFYNRSDITSVIIPDRVTSIGERAFENCAGLGSVTIGNGVTNIGGSAFSNCTSLTGVIIGSGVTSISDYAFYNCTALTEINFNAKECADFTTENHVFESAGQDRGGITVTFGSNAKKVPAYLFSSSAFSSTTFPKIVFAVIGDNVTSIGDRAFRACTSLIRITIGSRVTSVGYDVCSGCYKLEVYNKSDIHSMTFRNAWGLDSDVRIYQSEGYSRLTTDSNGFVIDTDSNGDKILVGYVGKESVITLPDDVTKIYRYAFYGCRNITDITISDSVTEIGRGAFGYCIDLTSITIPDSVKYIGRNWPVFNGCTSLTSVYYTGNVAGWCGITFEDRVANPLSYAHNLYIDNKLVTDLVIPASVRVIKSNAFCGAQCLVSVTIPSTVNRIESWVFSGCTSLTSVYYTGDVAGWCGIYFASESANPLNYAHKLYIDNTLVENPVIPDTVTEIKKYAFEGATCLKSVTIPDSVTSIGYKAFSGCSSLTSITIPSGVKSIGNYAFEDCTSLTSVAFGENSQLTSIEYEAFRDCTSLASITIPDSVTSIGYKAFSGCSSLTSITIPSGVTSIGSDAFSYCTSLTSVTIGSDVTNIEHSAFEYCYKLVEVYNKSGLTLTKGSEGNGYVAYYALNIYTEEGGSKLSMTDDGFILYTDGDDVIAVGYAGTATEIAIPSNVTKIYQYAFYNNTSLTSIIIPDSVTSIGYRAFYNCTSLTSVTIGSAVTSIGSYAFSYCTSLTSITIPDSVTSIGSDAFYGCTSFTSVMFDNTSGWKVSRYSDMSNSTSLTASDLADTSTAATYLSRTYRTWYWKRG